MAQPGARRNNSPAGQAIPSLAPRPLNAVDPDNGTVNDALQREEMCFVATGKEARPRHWNRYRGAFLLAPRILLEGLLDLFADLVPANPVPEYRCRHGRTQGT